MANQFSGLPMQELIGAPLVAASQANNMMAVTQAQFLLNTCFELKRSGDKEIYEPIMINMKLIRPVINADGTASDSVESEFNLPLLTIIPLNSLVVDEVDISFEMEVKSSFSNEKSANNEAENKSDSSLSKKLNTSTMNSVISGTIGASRNSSSGEDSKFSKSNSAKYAISTHAGQLPLPVGVTTIIDSFSKAIAPIQLKD